MMLATDNLPLIIFLAVLHCVVGTAAGLVAKRKGRNFPLWLGFGLIGGTFALIAAFLVPSQENISA
jgi:hypothetical protein